MEENTETNLVKFCKGNDIILSSLLLEYIVIVDVTPCAYHQVNIILYYSNKRHLQMRAASGTKKLNRVKCNLT